MKHLILVAILALLGACDDESTLPLPQAQVLNDDAAGYYCQMVILEHEGPKGQLFLAGYPAPLWFSQVRDGLAYVKSTEQEGEVLVLYVNDMGEAISWAEPGETNWINASEAVYVVGSNVVGGMGAPEMVPFLAPAKAANFAAEHGGEILLFDEITAELVLAPVDFDFADPEDTQ